MLSALQAESDIRGNRIDLSWCWLAPGDRPGFRLQRQRRAYPRTVDDGARVADFEDLFTGLSVPSVRVKRSAFLPPATEVESGLQLAELALHSFGSDPSAEPYRAIVGYFDAAAATYQTVALADVSRVTRLDVPDAPWTNRRTVEIFVAPGGTEASAGRVEVLTGHEDGVTPDRFEWIPASGTPVAIDFDRSEDHTITVTLDESLDPDSGDWKRQVRIEDGGLQPEQVYYYQIFAPADSGPDPYRSERDWRRAVMATGRYGLSDQLYRLLPSVHQYYDEPDPARRGEGQLRRFLSVFGAALDQARSGAEGLRARHDLRDVGADALPSLARWIGWQPDLTLEAPLLRNDILQAPEIFRTMGTAPNLRAMVNRVTGWDCEIKEFAQNVLLTNAPESITLWEIWGQSHDGATWSPPTALTRTETFDGRPVLAAHAGAPWLVWHADRDGPRDLWLMTHDGGIGPYRAALHASEDPWSRPVNEYPAVLGDGAQLWLFWGSNRGGSWCIWGAWDTAARPFEDMPDGPAENLTGHPAEDRHPAAVLDSQGRVRLFWQSNRRGPTDIWTRVHDPVDGWGDPMRVTTATFRHEQPAVLVDGDGRLWLFYSDDSGDRRNLVLQTYESDTWSAPVLVTYGPWRDEAPAAVLQGGSVRLFWHSNANGAWQIREQSWQWNATDARPEPVSTPSVELTTDRTADKEPSAFVDSGGDLHLVWRSQRRGRDYQSRTIDFNDAEMLARLGSFEDRAHYTYDTETTENDFYARNAIGVYLTPETEQSDVVDRNRRLVEGPLQEFLPIHVRPVLFIKPAVHKEYVYTYDFPEIEPQRTIGEIFERETTAEHAETYSGLGDAYVDTVPEWLWLHSWATGHDGHGTVDTSASPVDIRFRTPHIGAQPGG